MLTISEISNKNSPYHAYRPITYLKGREIVTKLKIQQLQSCNCNLNDIKSLFALAKELEYLQQEIAEYNTESVVSDNTSRLVVSNINFNEINSAVVRNKFFLVITGPNAVYTSKFINTSLDYVVFSDVFMFEQCLPDFRIDIQLYSVKISAQLWSLLKKVVPYISIRFNLDDFECFELVQRFNIERKDLHRMHLETKFAIFCDEVYIKQCTYGDLIYVQNKSVIKKCLCELNGSQFKITFNYDRQKIRQLLFDLRYSGFAEIRNGALIFKSVRSRRPDEIGQISLKSSPKFVFTYHCFKGEHIEFWQKIINKTVQILVDWNFSYLRYDELYYRFF